MYLLRPALLYLICALFAPSSFAQEAKPLTVDELVAKNIEAKGGEEALSALQSLRLTGKLWLTKDRSSSLTRRPRNGPGRSAQRRRFRA